MIRVAFVIWSLSALGGSERVVYDIVRKLDRERYKALLISFGDGPVKRYYEDLGVTVHVIPQRERSRPEFLRELKKVLGDEKVDIVNPHHFGPFLHTFLSSRRAGVKIVYTEHSRWQLEQLNPVFKMVNRVMLRKAHAVVAISRQIERYYLENLLLENAKVHLIPNGIDLSLYEDKGDCRLRGELGIGPGDRLVGVVANLRPEKNHKLLISAFSAVAEKLSDVRLLIAGEDAMNGEVQQCAARSGHRDRILFLGRRDDVPQILGMLDVFCLPSLYEGLPLTVLEAMAAGVPVVGSDVQGINEVVQDDRNGLLFPSNDRDRLAGQLIRLLENAPCRDRLSSAGRSFVRKHFSLDEAVRKYDLLFQSVQGGPASTRS